MKFNLNEIRKFAGLPLTEEMEDKQHEQKERELFTKACKCMEDVAKMCEQRLKEDLTEEHKKQYKDLHECAAHCCEVMKKHLDSYK